MSDCSKDPGRKNTMSLEGSLGQNQLTKSIDLDLNPFQFAEINHAQGSIPTQKYDIILSVFSNI